MEKVDVIIENGTILTMDERNNVIEEGIVCIKGDSILYVGPAGTKSFEAKKRINAKGGLVLPGLINGHTHAAMSLFRGLADDLPLMEWLNNYIFPAESKMDRDFVHKGTLLACAEMILSGTTTFCDMYLFEDEVAKAVKEAGMRCVVGEVLYDFPSPNYGDVGNGLGYTEYLIQKWRNDPLVSIAVEPHSLFTCGPDLLKRTDKISREYCVPLIIHVAETQNEVEQISKTYGKLPVEHLRALGLLGPHLIADHCVHLQDREIEYMAEHDVKCVHNPESNMKLASGIAPVPKMLPMGITVGLGTDGCASNNNIDMFGEMDMAAKLHKVQSMDTTVMDAQTVLRMATIEGARALGLGDIIGSLETGKKADIIVVDTNRPHLTPIYDPVSHLVYAANGSDVIHVLINGMIVMEERELLTLSLDEVMLGAKEKATQVRDWVWGNE